MTRQIKFRCWDKEKKKMSAGFDIHGLYTSPDDTWIDVTDDSGLEVENPLQQELMQFTGLLDKNGKECFEGDIVKRYEHDDICEVVYRDYWGAFVFKGKTEIPSVGHSYMHSGHTVFPWEIIGNIYEHPELLTSK